MADIVDPGSLLPRALDVLLAPGQVPAETLSAVLSLVCSSGLADSAQVYVVDADDVHLRLVALHAVDPGLGEALRELLSDVAIRIDSTLSGRAATSSEPVVLNNVRATSMVLPPGFREHLETFDVRHIAAVQVPGGERPLGSLVASRSGRHAPFTAQDVATLDRVASVSALAVERTALLARVARQADILDRVGDAVVAVDENRIVTKWNRGAERLYGIPREEAVGQPLGDLVTILSHARQQLDEAWGSLHQDAGWRDAVRQITRDGRIVEVEAFVTPLLDEASGFGGAVAVNRDMSESVRAQRELAERQAFAEAVLDALPGRTAVVGDDGRVRAVNRRYELEGPFGEGADSGPDVGADALGFLRLLAHGTPGIGVLVEAVAATLRGQEDSSGGSVDIPGPDDSWTAVQVVPFRGPGGGALVSFVDVSERKAHELELAHRATHDALTGLPNRALVLDRLRESLGRAYRRESRIAVLFVDLDGLKAVNDSRGHAAGDELIRAAAERLSRSSRVSDTVARVGGDEFVVLLDELADAAEAETFAERMLEALRAPLGRDAGGAGGGLTASIGVAIANGTANPVASDAEDLVRHADVAMLVAKRSGKDRVVMDTAPVRVSGQGALG